MEQRRETKGKKPEAKPAAKPGEEKKLEEKKPADR